MPGPRRFEEHSTVTVQNSSGSYRTTLEAFMKAYDKLPRRLRDALKYSAHDWVPQRFLTAWRQGATVDTLIERVGVADSVEFAMYEKDLACGFRPKPGRRRRT
jgi:hypothetical protein